MSVYINTLKKVLINLATPGEAESRWAWRKRRYAAPPFCKKRIFSDQSEADMSSHWAHASYWHLR